MNNIISLIEEAKRKDLVLDFYGEQSSESIKMLTNELGTKLPPSFIQFLKKYGGGGFVGEWISGIYGSKPALTNEGTVLGDTLRFRKSIKLGVQYIVIYSQEDEVIWCLDTSKTDEHSENPVVSIDVFGNELPLRLYDSFEAFFEDYLRIRVRGQDEFIDQT